MPQSHKILNLSTINKKKQVSNSINCTIQTCFDIPLEPILLVQQKDPPDILVTDPGTLDCKPKTNPRTSFEYAPKAPERPICSGRSWLKNTANCISSLALTFSM